jgi:hypothetical protein
MLPVVAQVATAQDGPILRMDFPETEAIPGLPLSLRLTVLVPTFMPEPPVWPTLEAPNLLVRLPEGATNPPSERIEGETWSGVTRHYRLSPMVPGEFAFPPQEVQVTWNDLDRGEVETVVLGTEAIAFRGVVPEGAEGLDPFIAAEALELTQDIEGTPDAMTPGDSLTRTVTARVEGVSPMFLPDLLPPSDIAGLAAYPDEPVLEESSNRGEITGTRVERVTYVAEGGGRGSLPAVTLDWYDIGAGEVRTAQLDAVEVAVDGPPAQWAEPRDPRALALTAAGGALGLILLLWAARRAAPVIRRAAAQRRERHLASERHAWSELRAAVAARDTARLRPALDLWAQRIAEPDPRTDHHVQSALVALGAARYGPGATPGTTAPSEAWAALDRALSAARTASEANVADVALPPLNPGAAR